MSLDDGDFLVKIKVKISKITAFQGRKLLNRFEKWDATCARMDGVGNFLAWEKCQHVWRGWHVWRASVCGELACVGWVRWMMFLVCFGTKMKKRLQIDRNSDLKEEPDLKSSRWFTLLEPPMQGS